MRLFRDIDRERFNRLIRHQNKEFVEKLKISPQANYITHNTLPKKRITPLNRQGFGLSNNSDAHEIVTKLISTGKSQRSIKSLMRYLARDGREKIYNDLGQEILSIDAHIKEGNYLPDSKNFSKKYKEANTKKKAKFKEADKYYKNQIHHFVLSFHYNDYNMGDEKFHKIASAFGHIFSADEHRFAYAIHKNKNPHIHYMIDSKSASGKQLHINRHELRNIRKIAAEICLENGLNYTAREIRERDSKQIEQIIIAQEKNKERSRRKTLLERQVPLFYKMHRLNRLKIENKQSDLESIIDLPPISNTASRELSRWAKDFKNQQIAEEIFLTLYAEKPSTAFYYANNKKGLFGELIDTTKEPLTIRKKNFKPTELWREESRNCIREKYQIIDYHENHRVELLETFIKDKETAKKQKRITKITAYNVFANIHITAKKKAWAMTKKQQETEKKIKRNY